ncbi:MAG: protein kinase [Ardenticatenaceae bacterium]|nr:protein kinase [Ardenticatenaceae bacterium]
MKTGSRFGAGPPPYLKERYRLVEWVGEGSMGVVYRAHDETLDRQVAIKFLPPGHVSGSEASDRFLREARAVARLSHPNIMTLFDVDREDGWFYLVLEYIPGHDLHTILTQKQAPLPLNEALSVVRGTLAALGYAHNQGIIHRDLKPENIMLTPDGRIKVTDFGLAQVQNEVRVTPAGALLGTVLYLAPELIVGQPATAASDLYAVGGILYELLTARPPFPGDQITAVLIKTLNESVIPPSQINPTIPTAIENVILKLLAKEPNGRFQSADEVLAELPVDPVISSHPEQTSSASSLVARIVRVSSTAVPLPKPPLEEAESLPGLLMAAALEDTAVALESERRRLAALLQESIIEPLTLLLSQASVYEQTMGANPTAHMAVSVLMTLTRQVLQQARDLENNLHPTLLETLGLEPALEALANQEMRTHGVQIKLYLRRLPERLPPAVELVLFRVTQAALIQAVKQAHATEMAIDLEQQDGRLVYRFGDNGRFPFPDDFFASIRPRVAGLGGVVEMAEDGRGFVIRFGLAAAVDLTPREMNVIQLLTEGLSNKEIALILSVSPRTVNFHLDNIYSKLGVGSRTEAAVYALRQGWVRKSES